MGFSPVAESGAILVVGMDLLWWLLLLRSVGSWVSVVAAGGLSSCGSWAWAQLLHGMWDLPESGIVPVTPALAGKILYH